ncbi:hypothetical protein XPN_2187 [Xanthomonas arboricola pv. pruni MAFF 301427]|nr:hypothetical protein XPN_2187 [Xanthomonas arboricola pv. pruni MAFF 301427]
MFATHAALIAALQADLAQLAVSPTQTQESSSMYEHTGAAAPTAATTAQTPPTLLVKGSRGSAMDRIVAALLTPAEDASHAA